jgi:hypothetical protein
MQARAAYFYISGLIGGGRYSDDVAHHYNVDKVYQINYKSS